MKLCRIALLLSVFALPSCFPLALVAVAGLTYGGIQYHENGASMRFKRSLPTCWKASKRALRRLHYSFAAGQKHKGNQGTLHGDGLELRLVREKGGSTNVIVKVGTFKTDDHQRQARLILEQLEKELK